MIEYDVMSRLPSLLTKRDLTHVAQLCSKALKRKAHESISLTCVTEARIKRLNKACLNKDRPTDVLSFASVALDSSQAKEKVTGDIVIAPAYAKKEAVRRSVPYKEELIRLIIHGTLHLYGFDHATEDEETRMFTLQEQLVENAISLTSS